MDKVDGSEHYVVRGEYINCILYELELLSNSTKYEKKSQLSDVVDHYTSRIESLVFIASRVKFSDVVMYPLLKQVKKLEEES